MGNIIYFITFPKSKQNRAKCPQAFTLNPNEDKKVHFLIVILLLSYNFNLLKQNVKGVIGDCLQNFFFVILVESLFTS